MKILFFFRFKKIKYIQLLLIIVFINFCSLSDPISEDYYKDNANIAGGEKPLTPELSYNTENISIQWTESIDPDTNLPVSTYFVYCYYKLLPEAYYLDEDIVYIWDKNESKNREFSFEDYIENYYEGAGVYYFTVTAFDGERESFHSNIVQIAFE
ncbi:MAG: hypothetical protein OEZ22_05860 [Spirochaetia bacterium]|nr:hypothetical protein [Spirochaetia bacterium]